MDLEPRRVSREHARVSLKNERIAELVRPFEGRKHDPHYLAFFACFNQGKFYEAHEVLEKIWLPKRHEAIGGFYKGLIQLAGAFVHLQKGRLRPAGALLKLAKEHLGHYPAAHEGLDLDRVEKLINGWLEQLESGLYERNPFTAKGAPMPGLELQL